VNPVRCPRLPRRLRWLLAAAGLFVACGGPPAAAHPGPPRASIAAVPEDAGASERLRGGWANPSPVALPTARVAGLDGLQADRTDDAGRRPALRVPTATLRPIRAIRSPSVPPPPLPGGAALLGLRTPPANAPPRA